MSYIPQEILDVAEKIEQKANDYITKEVSNLNIAEDELLSALAKVRNRYIYSAGYNDGYKEAHKETRDVAFSIFHDFEDLLKSKYSAFDHIDAYTALMELKEVCEKYTEV